MKSVVFGFSLVVFLVSAAVCKADDCASFLLTPAQIEGPFYPGYNRFHDGKHDSNDLTNAMRATGEIVVLRGRVVDKAGRAIPDAELHLWQTDGLAGKYNHPLDPDRHLVDRRFNSWGRTETAADGSYSFRTVRPIAYPAGEDWMRPDHFHLMVYVAGKPVLTTQMYFSDDRWLTQDLIFLDLSEEQKQAVLIDLHRGEAVWNHSHVVKNVSLGRFNVVLDEIK